MLCDYSFGLILRFLTKYTHVVRARVFCVLCVSPQKIIKTNKNNIFILIIIVIDCLYLETSIACVYRNAMQFYATMVYYYREREREQDRQRERDLKINANLICFLHVVLQT